MSYKVGDKVELIIGRISRLGFTVLIDKETEGLLYKNELFVKLEEGDQKVGYIKKMRDDGGIDVSLQPIGFKKTLVENEIKILDALKKNEGFIALHDKSSPDDIKHQMNMSKKAFKSAIGGLYRLKMIVILEAEGIRLIQN